MTPALSLVVAGAVAALLAAGLAIGWAITSVAYWKARAAHAERSRPVRGIGGRFKSRTAELRQAKTAQLRSEVGL